MAKAQRRELLPPCNGTGEGNSNPLQYSCLENSVDRGAWWAAVHGVSQSRTWLKQLIMHACIGEGNGNPLQYSCLENARDREAWWVVVYGVAQSRTRLKQLCSSSSSSGVKGSGAHICCINAAYWNVTGGYYHCISLVSLKMIYT